MSYGPIAHARTSVVLVALACGLFIALAANLVAGSVAVPLASLPHILLTPGGTDTFGHIIWSIRLPRIVVVAFSGASLALSGLLLQTLFQNPIAGPFVLGISQGAKLAVAVLFVCLAGPIAHPSSAAKVTAAALGAAGAMAISLAASRHVRSAAELTLAGVMVGYLANAAADLVCTFADDSVVASLKVWSQGSFSGMDWMDACWAAAVTCACIAWSGLLVKPMSCYLLGERYAASAGVDVRLFRRHVIWCASLTAASVTAFCGPVSFVGIAVPHIARRLLQTARPQAVVPATILAGAVFCLVADLIARTLAAPVELSVSSVTAVLGVPVVAAVIARRKAQRS